MTVAVPELICLLPKDDTPRTLKRHDAACCTESERSVTASYLDRCSRACPLVKPSPTHGFDFRACFDGSVLTAGCPDQASRPHHSSQSSPLDSLLKALVTSSELERVSHTLHSNNVCSMTLPINTAQLTPAIQPPKQCSLYSPPQAHLAMMPSPVCECEAAIRQGSTLTAEKVKEQGLPN